MADETKVNQAAETVETEPEVAVVEKETEVKAEEVKPEETVAEEVKPEGTEATEETFYDATKVPEALKSSFVEMQKSYTKKTQEVADVKGKAKLYEDLLEQSWFRTAAENEVKNEKVAAEPAEEIDPYETEGEKKMREKVTKMESYLQEQQVEKELVHINRLIEDKDNYPGFNESIPEIKRILDVNPNLSYEQAYYQVKGPELSKRPVTDEVTLRAQLLKEIEADRKAGTESGSSSAAVTVDTKKFGMSREGAEHYLNEAKKEVGK